MCVYLVQYPIPGVLGRATECDVTRHVGQKKNLSFQFAWFLSSFSFMQFHFSEGTGKCVVDGSVIRKEEVCDVTQLLVYLTFFQF